MWPQSHWNIRSVFPSYTCETINFNYNLGVAVACAIKAALEKHDISGKIELLGTPGNPFSHQLVQAFSAHISVAEEGGSGKVALLEKGAYKDMDVCLMYV